MLRIQVNMNSAVEEVLAFKTCCGLKAEDWNLEILIANEGERTAVLPSRIDLETATGTRRIETLMPTPSLEIPPGGVGAFYCQMDDALWSRARRLVLYDAQGGRWTVELVGAGT